MPYQTEVLAELRRARFADERRNYDPELGAEPAPGPTVRDEAVAAVRGNLTEAWRLVREAGRALAELAKHHLWPDTYFKERAAPQIAAGAYLYALLADRKSRDLLVKLIAFRVLGHRRVRLPRSTPNYWTTLDSMQDLVTDAPALPIKYNNLALPQYDARPLGFDLRVHTTNLGIAYALCQKQYEYHHLETHCKAEAGDVVIDAGGCWGETSMYFAHEVGPAGLCVAYEFIPSNVMVFRRNLALNPHLASWVRLVERPLWSHSGRQLAFVDWGPGSRVSDRLDGQFRPDGKVVTTTIDDTVRELSLERVDFIKMDIEGAELHALRGAEGSIRRFRPKLAISVYHRPEDFLEIPRYIEGLKLGYRFYLEHHTLYQNETVLFAVPADRPKL